MTEPMTSTAALTGTLAVLHDMAEEGWPSMDQMGRLLTSRVPALAPGLRVTPVTHRLRRVASTGPLASVRPAFFADRLLNRMVLYPRRVRQQVAGRFDLYHVADHSYSQLILELPGAQTLVTCHDVDTFRSIVRDGDERRPIWFRSMTRRILRGFRRAAMIVCVSDAARDDLTRFGLADASRIRVVPNGIDPALLEPPSDAALEQSRALLPPQRGVFDILHVGNDIPRKRVDRVIDIVATLRKRGHWIRLVRVGSPLRPESRLRAQELAMNDVAELRSLDRDVLRAVYERCDLVLLPSDREGYGLPVVEAFAAGKPVVASDIPALRESSGGLATCVKPDALPEWVDAIERVLREGDPTGALAAARRARAASLTWDDHVRGLLPLYAELLDRTHASRP
jgi:glycosyltransferase involved in cell wall biosynthesis